MWAQLVASWMSSKQSKGGGAMPKSNDANSSASSSAISDAVLDGSNWTVSTGSSKATGGTASPETQKTLLWVAGGVAVAALVVTVLVMRKGK